MAVSRRNLLRHSFVAAVAFAAGPFKAWGATKPQMPKDQAPNNNQRHNNVTGGTLQHLDREAFDQEVGSSFQVTPVSGKPSSGWLRLLAVKDLPALVPVNPASMAVLPPKQHSAHIQTSGFILTFLGTLPAPLPQGTYKFVHAGLGTFTLLIVPDGQGQQTYTAVINRLP